MGTLLMKEFDQMLQEEVAAYSGPHESLIRHAPEFYRLMTRLVDDPALPGRLRPLVIAAIAYFILPADISPEDLTGPLGFVDDIFLCAFAAERIAREVGSSDILTGNWQGSEPVIPLVTYILEHETELIGDKRELILWYIGYTHLPQ